MKANNCDYVTDNRTKWDVIRRLEEQRAHLDDSMTIYLAKSEMGQEIDMHNFYVILNKIEQIDTDLAALWQPEIDPFLPEDCQPEPEYQYDPALEWRMMTSELRRGEG